MSLTDKYRWGSGFLMRPTSLAIRANSRPDCPTKGFPISSSSLPQASPMNMTFADLVPEVLRNGLSAILLFLHRLRVTQLCYRGLSHHRQLLNRVTVLPVDLGVGGHQVDVLLPWLAEVIYTYVVVAQPETGDLLGLLQDLFPEDRDGLHRLVHGHGVSFH